MFEWKNMDSYPHIIPITPSYLKHCLPTVKHSQKIRSVSKIQEIMKEPKTTFQNVINTHNINNNKEDTYILNNFFLQSTI